MTKRKRMPALEDILERPWCYYCERDFDDMKILVSHQRARHFKCNFCPRRLNTAGGLSVHMGQVHKENLQYIENALPNRKDPTIEVFGMEGIPQDVKDAFKYRVTTEYFKTVAAHRAATGNSLVPTEASQPAKKVHIETPEELRARLAEHKARKEAERRMARGESDSASTTPINPVGPFSAPAAPQYGEYPAMSPAVTMEPMYAGSPLQMEPFQASYNSAPYPPPHGFPPIPPPMAMSPGLGPPPMHFGPPPSMPGMTPGPPSWSPAPPHAYGQQFPAKATKPRTEPPKQNTLDTDVPGLPARPTIDAPSFSREDMARMHMSAPIRLPQGQTTPLIARTGPPPLPVVAGNENVSFEDDPDDLINQIRESQKKQNITHAVSDGPHITSANTVYEGEAPAIADPIAGVSNDFAKQGTGQLSEILVAADVEPARAAETTNNGNSTSLQHDSMLGNPGDTDNTTVQGKSTETASKKRGKKPKADTKTKLVYSDNLVCPEEKRASLPRYAFNRNDHTVYAQGDVAPAVTGAVRGSDDVMDAQSAH